MKILEKGGVDQVDFALMAHACYYTLIEHDFIASATYVFHFNGKTAHAAVAPHDGINALDAAVLAYNGIAVLRQQVKGDHRIHVQIRFPETPLNMIPEKASCIVMMRAATTKELQGLIQRVNRCGEGAASATACNLQVEQPSPPYHHMNHNSALNDLFRRNLEAVGVKEDRPEKALTASTDAGNVSQKIPTIHPMVAICGPEVLPHTKEFTSAAISERGEKTFLACAKAMAMTAVDLMGSPELAKSIEQSHRAF